MAQVHLHFTAMSMYRLQDLVIVVLDSFHGWQIKPAAHQHPGVVILCNRGIWRLTRNGQEQEFSIGQSRSLKEEDLWGPAGVFDRLAHLESINQLARRFGQLEERLRFKAAS